MKNSKSHKMNKLTKTDYHTDVVPAFVAYRKQMEAACGIKRNVSCNKWCYARLFTEQRVNGARTKFWYAQNALPVAAIVTYIKNNPTFVSAAGRTFTVTAKYVQGSRLRYIL
jgi:hypothetical protein